MRPAPAGRHGLRAPGVCGAPSGRAIGSPRAGAGGPFCASRTANSHRHGPTPPGRPDDHCAWLALAPAMAELAGANSDRTSRGFGVLLRQQMPLARARIRCAGSQGNPNHGCAHNQGRQQHPQTRAADVELSIVGVVRSRAQPTPTDPAPGRPQICQPQDDSNEVAAMVSTMHRLSGALQPLKPRMIRHRQAPVPLGFAPGSRHRQHPSGAENVGL